MGNQDEEPLIHWNYFLALESDLENASRFVEFSQKNFDTYSIEFAHLLLATSSEVDVVCKEICKILKPNKKPNNITGYQKIILSDFPDFPKEKVYFPRYGRSFTPWERWENEQSPLWWQSYNDVKHARSNHFEEANLKNVLNSIGGLLIVVFYFYKLKFSSGLLEYLKNKDVTRKLMPESTFLKLSPEYYNVPILWD